MSTFIVVRIFLMFILYNKCMSMINLLNAQVYKEPSTSRKVILVQSANRLILVHDCSEKKQ